MSRSFWISIARIVFMLAIAGAGAFYYYERENPAHQRTEIRPASRPAQASADSEELGPLPEVESFDPRKVALGRDLFHDVRFSKNNSVSCASCHVLERGGVDGTRFSPGVEGALGTANTPTVFNSSLNFRQFWDGRAESLEAQIDGPVTNPRELASDWDSIVRKLREDQALVARFEGVYQAAPDRANITDAIVSFEKTLITANSRFDRYARGEKTAMAPDQLEGLKKFKSYGCVACHQGRNVGGNMFQSLGVASDYFRDRGGFFESDLGRFNVTKDESDKYVFRVPSLRNVELTAPYFHDGSAATLRDAIGVMAKYQLGREIPAEDVVQIEAFLRSLTGELPATVRATRGVAYEPDAR